MGTAAVDRRCPRRVEMTGRVIGYRGQRDHSVHPGKHSGIDAAHIVGFDAQPRMPVQSVTVREGIDGDHGVAVVEKFRDQDRADIAGGSGDQDGVHSDLLGETGP